MENINNYIRYDLNKIESIGFNKSTVEELILELDSYLTRVEAEYNIGFSTQKNQETYVLEMLHKIEGALHYLALTGPIEYIKEIRVLIRSTPGQNIEQLINTLFRITHETLIKLSTYITPIKK